MTYAVRPDRIHATVAEHVLADGFHVAIDLAKSHGSWIHDAVSGQEILDFYSYFASLPLGHNHPKVAGDEEFLKTLTRAALANPSNSDISTAEYAAFIETFAEIAKPAAFEYLFFVAGGALAVENALKTAFDWKAGLNREAGRQAKGQQVIHFREAFHGRSGYTLALTNTDPVKIADFPRFDWPRVLNPKLEFPLTAEVERRTAELERQAIEQIEDAFAHNPHDIAAVIIEPIQGEGGDNHFRSEFFQALRRLADEHEALLVFDEVQTGLGLTGKMWAFEHFGVTPDIVAFGKKTQVCGIMSTDRVDSYSRNVFHTPGRINSTWGGNLVDMVRCNKYLRVIREEDLVANAERMGRRLLGGLEELASRFQVVANVRGRGLMTAFTLPSTEIRNQLRSECWRAGLATLPSGARSIRFRPCLDVDAEAIDRGLEILESSLRKVVAVEEVAVGA
jgi:L-lysine 6-transaminase